MSARQPGSPANLIAQLLQMHACTHGTNAKFSHGGTRHGLVAGDQLSPELTSGGRQLH